MAENHLSFYRVFCMLLEDNEIQDKLKFNIGLGITNSIVSFYLFLYVFTATWHKYGTNGMSDLYYFMSNCLNIIVS